ncbi:MAG: RHS repeat-associated core domain-containing protein [Pseudomonadota bacterium]
MFLKTSVYAKCVAVFVILFTLLSFSITVLADEPPTPIYPPGDLPPDLPEETTAELGTIPDTMEVTKDGAAVYTMPIDVPPGRQGIQPNLALQYNSRAGDGLVGIRWALSGATSFISRCGSNYGMDEVLRPVKNDVNDKLCLDGQRLVLYSGTYGYPGAIYRTDQDSFVKVVQVGGDTTNGAEYFEVWTKDGQKMIYGCNDMGDDACKSALVKARDGVRRSWALREVRDRQNNYMLYEYAQTLNQSSEIPAEADKETVEIVPVRIDYTGNSTAATDPAAYVEFSYDIGDARTKDRHGFYAGIRTGMFKLLTGITTGIDGNVVKHYDLDYIISNYHRPRLDRITELEHDTYGAAAKPPTYFDWQNDDDGFESAVDTGMTVSDMVAAHIDPWDTPHLPITGDINGDGFPDIVYPLGSPSRIHLAFGNGAGFDAVQNTGIPFVEWGDTTQVSIPFGLPLDYNQDGLLDILLFHYGSNYLEFLISTGTGFTLQSTSIPIIEGHPLPSDYRDIVNNTHVVDLNGDGRKDFLFYFEDGSYQEWHYRLHNGTGFGTKQIITQLTGTPPSYSANPDNALLLDYNADGAVDLLVGDSCSTFPCPNNYYVVHFINPSTPYHFIASTNLRNLPDFGPATSRRVLDVNGDGLEDILYVEDEAGSCPEARNCVRMWINTGKGDDIDGFIGGLEGFDAIENEGDLGMFYDQTMRYAQSFDHDGDGIWDLLVPKLFEGSPPSGGHQYGEWQICSGNGTYVGEYSGGYWGDSTFGFSTCADIDIPFYSYDWTIQNPISMDINGDLVPDLLTANYEDNTLNTYWYHTHYTDSLDLITIIRNGNIGISPGHADWDNTFTYKIEYKPTTDSTVYSPDFDSSLLTPETGRTSCGASQICNINPQMMVVSALYVDTGVQESGATVAVKTNYKYHDSRYDRIWGWLGFGQRVMTQTDTLTTISASFDNITYNSLLKRYPYLGMVNQSCTLVELATGRKTMNCASNSYDYRTPWSGLTWFPYLGQSDAYVKEWVPGTGLVLLSQSTTTNVYDNYGNITNSEVDHLDGNMETVEIEYINDVTNWRLGLVDYKTVGSDTPTTALVEQHTDIIYLPSSFLVDKVIKEPGDANLELTTEFEYDDFGNVIQTRSYNLGGSANSRYTVTQYYSDGLYPKFKINALGHVLETSFNREFGLVASSRDSNGVVTQNAYDGFGRMKKTLHPNSTISSLNYTTSTDPYGHLRRVVEMTATNSPKVSTEYLRTGKETKIEKENFDGSQITTTYSYDPLGRLYATHVYDGGTGIFRWHLYDNLGRIIQIESSGGIGPLITEYEGLLVKKYDGKGNKTEYHYNNLGQVVTVKDPYNNATLYDYGAFGTNVKITDAKSNQTEMIYDKYGRPIQINDPDTGTTFKQYNGYGELWRVIDEAGRIVDTTYDKLGRPLTERYTATGEGQDYIYDTAAHDTFYGAMVKMTTTGSEEETMYYDNLGRLTQKNTKINGVTYTTTRQYSATTGKLWKYYYPAAFSQSFGVEYKYNTRGYLEAVKNASTGYTYWTMLEMNEAGQLAEYSLGNGLTGSLTYEPSTGRNHEIKILDGTTKKQWLEFLYDQNNNIIRRDDHVRNVSEDLAYDNLNRLVESEVNGGGLTLDPETGKPLTPIDYHQTYTYDEIGNITYKSNVGTYKYTSAKPHAVIEAGAMELSYDAVGNVYHTSSPTKDIEYTYFNKPKEISISGKNTAFEYNALKQRVRQVDASNVQTIYVDGGTEIIRDKYNNPVQYRYYVSAAGLPVARVKKWKPSSIVLTENLYLHPDNLGSINMITDISKNVSKRMFFNGFGETRQYNWGGAYGVVEDGYGINYGFTGHEHDEDTYGLKLINMKGREYDPKIGRFMQADPIVQAPFFGQSLNRYSYVWNNPINLTDPSGYEVGGCGSDPYCSEVHAKPLIETPWPEPNFRYERTPDQPGVYGGLAMDPRRLLNGDPLLRSWAREIGSVISGIDRWLSAPSGLHRKWNFYHAYYRVINDYETSGWFNRAWANVEAQAIIAGYINRDGLPLSPATITTVGAGEALRRTVMEATAAGREVVYNVGPHWGIVNLRTFNQFNNGRYLIAHVETDGRALRPLGEQIEATFAGNAGNHLIVNATAGQTARIVPGSGRVIAVLNPDNPSMISEATGLVARDGSMFVSMEQLLHARFGGGAGVSALMTHGGISRVTVIRDYDIANALLPHLNTGGILGQHSSEQMWDFTALVWGIR